MNDYIYPTQSQEAIKLLDSGVQVDLMFIDQTLSLDGDKLRGCDVVNKLRREGHNRTFVIGLTGNTHRNKNIMIMSGAKDVWEKPLKPAEFIKDDLTSMFDHLYSLRNSSYPLFDKLFKSRSCLNSGGSAPNCNPVLKRTKSESSTSRHWVPKTTVR